MVSSKILSIAQKNRFQFTIYQYYKKQVRTLPWRQTRNPYYIFISEVMLQQTQVPRVLKKYPPFIVAFPDFTSLARAPLRRVMKLWQGLGYNRRALLLKKAAAMVVNTYQGKLPLTMDELIKLPGVGKTTAGAIMVFAFNKPAVFIETNIRSVFIHFFFKKRKEIDDEEILSLIGQTVAKKNPRIWYWALMDYGVMLKKKYLNPSQKSAHYIKATPFQGSDRQIRGLIIKALISGSLTEKKLIQQINKDSKRIKENLIKLNNEELLKKVGERYLIR